MQNPADNAFSQAQQMFTFWQQMYMQWMSMFMANMPGMPMPSMPGPHMPFGRQGPFDPSMWGTPPNMPNAYAQQYAHKDRAFGITLEECHGLSKLWFQLQAPVNGAGWVRLRNDNGSAELSFPIDESGSVRIQLDPDQAAGRYTGQILDRNGMHCGDLELTVSHTQAQQPRWPTAP